MVSLSDVIRPVANSGIARCNQDRCVRRGPHEVPAVAPAVATHFGDYEWCWA